MHQNLGRTRMLGQSERIDVFLLSISDIQRLQTYDGQDNSFHIRLSEQKKCPQVVGDPGR